MLQPMKVRLSDADREEYGIAQEWLPIRAALFIERRVSVLREWERETDVKVLDLIAGEVDVRSLELLAATIWLSCKLNDVPVPAFADFDPHVLDAKLLEDPQPEGDDVDPPSSSSADNSAETPVTATKPSRSGRGSKR